MTAEQPHCTGGSVDPSSQDVVMTMLQIQMRAMVVLSTGFVNRVQ